MGLVPAWSGPKGKPIRRTNMTTPPVELLYLQAWFSPCSFLPLVSRTISENRTSGWLLSEIIDSQLLSIHAHTDIKAILRYAANCWSYTKEYTVKNTHRHRATARHSKKFSIIVLLPKKSSLIPPLSSNNI